MRLSDAELGILEHLNSINEGFARKVGIKYPIEEGDKISDILKDVDFTKLKANPNETDGTWIQYNEWANTIKYIKKSELSELTVKKIDNSVHAIVYADEKEPSNAIVAFDGTHPEEWLDNADGIIMSDTPRQKQALNFINSLPYKNITVTGHSKGGNKAMYVGILSDKVTRVVGFDGQGFSKEFIEKYRNKIEERSYIITNRALSNDFVNDLFFPIPGSNQLYHKGYGVKNIAEFHAISSLYKFDKDGNPILYNYRMNKGSSAINKLSTYMSNNATKEEKMLVVNFMKGIFNICFIEKKASPSERLNYILNYISENPEQMQTVLKFLVNTLNYYEVEDLLKMFGVEIPPEYVKLFYGFLKFVANNADTKDFGQILKCFKNILDYKEKGFDFKDINSYINILITLDGAVEFLAYFKIYLDEYGADDLIAIWGEYDVVQLKFVIKSVSMIYLPNTKKVIKSIINRKNKNVDLTTSKENNFRDSDNKNLREIRDFTNAKYESFIDIYNKVERVRDFNLNWFSKYSHTDWYHSINVKGDYEVKINKAFSFHSECNKNLKDDVTRVFEYMRDMDSIYSKKFRSLSINLNKIKID